MTTMEKNETTTTQNSTDKKKPSRASKWGCCCIITACVIGALLIFITFIVPSLLNARRATWESGAKGTLRSCRDAQLDFSEGYGAGNFGEFNDLQDAGLIHEEYTLDNMIDNYTMTWAISSSVVQTEGPAIFDQFEIVAYPRDTRPGYLNTFAVTEDEVVRVYVPDMDNDIDDVNTWEPIL